MVENQELVTVLNELTEKIRNREITCEQLKQAMAERNYTIRDFPQREKDPAVMKAIESFAGAVVDAAFSTGIAVDFDWIWGFGYGVAVGTCGKEFLRNFLAEAVSPVH